MRAYIVRHADANSKAEDPQRHLSETGLAQARGMADFLRPPVSYTHLTLPTN